MKEVSISEFRSKCFEFLDQVQNTVRPIRITRFGKPVAEIVPASSSRRWLGTMKGTARILGDIVGPTTSEDDWDAFR